MSARGGEGYYKVLPITLVMLREISAHSSAYFNSYSNCSFEYLLFVGRVIHTYPHLLFSDQTALLSYQADKQPNLAGFEKGHYYQCLCSIKRDSKSCAVIITEAIEIEGNGITNHFLHTLRTKMNQMVAEWGGEEEENEKKKQTLYWQMRKLCKDRKGLGMEEVLAKMGDRFQQSQFDHVLDRLQGEGVLRGITDGLWEVMGL